ncbi:MAG: lipopolysaccharide heptosyltransferase II [Planctomycetota bacterium]
MADAPRNVLIVMPTWVGDCVMATPTLRSLRALWPDARITALVRRNCKPLLRGIEFIDRIIAPRKIDVVRLAPRIRRARFDAAVLLPNSFKTALLARSAGITRRIGYDRDGRGFLLTDKLLPDRHAGQYKVVPTIRYYLALAGYLGGETRDASMHIAVTPADTAAADSVLQRAGATLNGQTVLLNPGAQFGAAKLWLPEYFAEVADAFSERGATVLVSAAPGETGIIDAIASHAKRPFVDLARHGMSLGALKSMCGRADLVITNDTGPRHIAAALRTRLVTIFGPTDPRWTTLDFPLERELQEDVFCGPCQKKLCPLDHRCMTQLTPDAVVAACDELLATQRPLPVINAS